VTLGLGGENGSYDDPQVVVGNGVDHYEAAIAYLGEQFGNLGGAAVADVAQRYHHHVVPMDTPTRLLLDPCRQVRVSEAERGIMRELGFGDWYESTVGEHPLKSVDRDAASVDISRDGAVALTDRSLRARLAGEDRLPHSNVAVVTVSIHGLQVSVRGHRVGRALVPALRPVL
jgi:hypothetical protein